jgi:hypothetical protein
LVGIRDTDFVSVLDALAYIKQLFDIKQSLLQNFFSIAQLGAKAVEMNAHLSFEDGWRVLEQGIVTCSKILEGSTGTRPTVAEYMNCYEYDSLINSFSPCNLYNE